MKTKLSSAALLFVLAGCAVDPTSDQAEATGETAEAIVGANVIAWSSPAALRQSTGNLYWTTNSLGEFGGGYTAAFYRTGKTSTPGQEILLYQETSPTPVQFGALTYAEKSGAWYGYFVANYGTQSQIKRVPLGGGGATTLAVSPSFIGERAALEADDTNLYWADDTGVRTMPIGGGPVTTLASLTGIVGLAIDGFYAYVASGNTIYSIDKTGGALTWRANGQDVITSISATVGVYLAEHTSVAWTERSGGVGEKEIAAPEGGGTDEPTSFVFTPGAGYTSSSVTVNGEAQSSWITCTSPGSSSCTVYLVGTAQAIGGVGARFLQIDGVQMYWGDAGSVKHAALPRVIRRFPL